MSAIFDDLIKRVHEACPPMNDYALRGFVKDNIDNSPDFVAHVFREGFKLIPGNVQLMGYTVMTPEERVKFELRSGNNKSNKPKIPLTTSHLRLVRFKIRFDEENYEANLYTPYMVDDMLHIRGKNSMIRKIILEQTFSRVNEKDKDGMSASPIRVNITFNRRTTYRIESYVTGRTYTKFVVSARLFHGTIKNKLCDVTIVHYMLAKFGFLKTLAKFGLTREDVDFRAEVGGDTEEYEYFAAKRFDDTPDQGPGLFLRVRKTLLGDDQSEKFVVNLLYVLLAANFKLQTIDNVYIEQGSIWKIMLGVIILEDKAELRAYTNAESHLKSVDHFIDDITRRRFRTFGVPIDDIYDLLVYAFINIDSFMVNNQAQDLYSSRLDVSNGILVKSFAERIYKNIYIMAKKSNISSSDVKAMLRLNPMMFRQPSTSRSDEDKDMIAPPEIIGDNFLLSGGLGKIRLGGKPEQRLHPSMVVAESVSAFVGKTIGRTGYLNPFIPTDINGAIQHPDYAKEIDEVSIYLPR